MSALFVGAEPPVLRKPKVVTPVSAKVDQDPFERFDSAACAAAEVEP